MWFMRLPRFTLRTMLVATTLAAIALAAFGQRLAPRDQSLQTRSLELLSTDSLATESTLHAALKEIAEETLALEGFTADENPFRAQLISPQADSRSVSNQLAIDRRDSTRTYQRVVSTRLLRRNPWNLVGVRLRNEDGQAIDVAIWYYTEPNTGLEEGVQVHLQSIVASDRLNLMYAEPVAESLCRDVLNRVASRLQFLCRHAQLREV